MAQELDAEGLATATPEKSHMIGDVVNDDGDILTILNGEEIILKRGFATVRTQIQFEKACAHGWIPIGHVLGHDGFVTMMRPSPLSKE